MVKWKDLTYNTKCIYQAFQKATGHSGKSMADWVNAQGVDADDGQAVTLLAKHYGFSVDGAYTGQFLASGSYNFSKNKEFVVVITTHGDTAKAPATRALFVANDQDLLKDLDPTEALTDPKYVNVQWHAVYGKSDFAGQITWIDPQGQRLTGPKIGDYFVTFER